MNEHASVRAARCYGFGERKDNCPNKPGGKWSPYFCPACDEERMAHLNKQFAKIEERFRA